MKPLCYPVLDERGMTIVTVSDGIPTRSHVLARTELFQIVEKALQAIQISLREDKSE